MILINSTILIELIYHSVENEYGSMAYVATSKIITNGFENDNFYIGDIPCWSLVALLNILPNYQLQTQDDGIGILCSCNGKFNIITASNPIDACVNMIIRLNELKIL